MINKRSITLSNSYLNNLKQGNSKGLVNMDYGLYSLGTQSINTTTTMNTTNSYFREFDNIYESLNQLRDKYIGVYHQPSNTLRNKGVELAWKYEQAEIQLGGRGSTDWNDGQLKEIIEIGKVKGAEGHHINNVANNPENQANPDNIKFAKDRKEHLDMHDGDFRNPTNGEEIDRNSRLERINRKRVVKNELCGLGIAIAAAFGIGFTLNCVISLAREGISQDSIKNATLNSIKPAGEVAILGGIGHIASRSIGEVVITGIQGQLGNLGIEITKNLAMAIKTGVVGSMMIAINGVYQFAKLKRNGYTSKEALIRTTKTALESAIILAISVITIGKYGKSVGLIVSLGISAIIISNAVITHVKYRKLNEDIIIYSIQKSIPQF